MNYYKRHIGDYAAATRHLSMLEHGAYNLMMDTYYTTEKPLPVDVKDVFRKVGARTKEECVAVEALLHEFFTLTDKGWVQSRCQSEITVFQQKAETNKVIGKRGGRPKKETQTVNSGNPEITQTVSENSSCSKPNETLTTNQEPLTINHNKDTLLHQAGSDDPPRVSKTAAVCMVMRSEGIGSVNPSNPDLAALIDVGAQVGQFADAAKTAVGKGKGFAYALGIVRGQLSESKALAIEVQSPSPNGGNSPESFAEKDARIARSRWEQMTGQTHPDNALPPSVIDVSATSLEIAQ